MTLPLSPRVISIVAVNRVKRELVIDAASYRRRRRSLPLRCDASTFNFQFRRAIIVRLSIGRRVTILQCFSSPSIDGLKRRGGS